MTTCGWTGGSEIDETKKVDVSLTHISNIRPGDTVEHNGHAMTVCSKDIRRGFMGVTLFGDSYRLGHELVRKINISRALPALAYAVADAMIAARETKKS